MNWNTTITDVQQIDNSSQVFVLASASKDDYVGISAVLVFDLDAENPIISMEVPLTSWTWISMAQNCAGNEFILGGAEYAHHTWYHGALKEHPKNITFRSGRIWKESDEKGHYCGGDRIISITRQKDEEEIFAQNIDLMCIHGLHSQFKVVGGAAGYLAIHRGQGWQPVDDVPTLDNIVDIYCANENEIYFCAGYGGVFRWNGGSDWFRYETEPESFFYRLCKYQERICVASLNLKSYWLDGDVSTLISEAKVATRFSSGNKYLFGLGINGKFESFDGSKWRTHELDLYRLFSKQLENLYASAPGP